MSPNKRNVVIVTTVMLLFFSFLPPASAQIDIGMKFATPIGLATNDIREIVASIIRAGLGMIGFILFLQILHGGVKYMIAGGSEDARDEAVSGIKNSIIGFIIIMSAASFTQFILSAIINATGGTLL